jgi:hypothetical protein
MGKTTYELPVYVDRELKDEAGEVLKDPGGAIASLLVAEDDRPPEITSLIEYLDVPKEPPIPMAVILEQGQEYELLDILNFSLKTGKNNIQYPTCQYVVRLHDGEIVTVFSDLDSAKFLLSMQNLGVTIDPKTEPQILEVTYAETVIEADGKETHRASPSSNPAILPLTSQMMTMRLRGRQKNMRRKKPRICSSFTGQFFF